MITYRKLALNDLDHLFIFYNRNISGIYRPVTRTEFNNNFYEHPEFNPECAFVAVLNEEIIGFCMGHIRHIEQSDENLPGYITTILVDKNYRLQKIGTTLVNLVIDYLKKNNKKYLCFGYTSTLNWPWIIPNTHLFDHNGAPGASINSDIYYFLLKLGFDIVSTQDAFCLELKYFKASFQVQQNLERLKKQGITIEIYNPLIHYGLDAFYEEINAEPFERAIRKNLLLQSPYPFAVISNQGQISGWTGAFYTEPSGRAHFDGIIIAPRMRGKGLGKALFSFLADYSYHNGSRFMTFFTDRTNFARKMYLELGFQIVHSFVVMQKAIEKNK